MMLAQTCRLAARKSLPLHRIPVHLGKEAITSRAAVLVQRPWLAQISRPCTGTANGATTSGFEEMRLALGKHAQWFVHFGNLVLLLAVNQTDMLNMRLMMVSASTMGMCYNLLQPKPLIPPAIWGLFFIGSHVYNIYVLLKERQCVILSEDQEKVYEGAFMQYGFTPRQFVNVMEEANAQWCNFMQGSFVFRRGDPLKQVHWLMEGEGEMVGTTDDTLFKVRPGKGGWLGEFFDPNAKPETHTEEAWAARKHFVSFKCTAAQCRTIAFDMRKVQEVMHSNPRLKELATRAEVSDLWGKLHRSLPEHRRQTYEAMVAVAASDGEIEDREVKLLQDFRSRHKLPESAHLQALEKIGWTPKDWSARRKIIDSTTC